MKNIKKIFAVALSCALAVCMLALVACGDPKPNPNPDPKPEPEISVTLDKTEATVEEGKTVTLTATVKNSTEKAVFDSSNKSAATVTANGNTATVTAVAAGETNITAKVGTKTATCKVTVTAKPVASISVDKEFLVMENGGELATAEINVTLANSTEAISCESADDKIVTVAVAGNKVTATAVATGKTTLTVKAGTLEEEVPVEVSTAGLTYTLTQIVVGEGDEAETRDAFRVRDGETAVSGAVVIASQYYSDEEEDYFPVIEIAEEGFKDNKTITSLVLGDEMIKIGNNAFKGCAALASVKTNTNLQSVGDWAFGDCSELASFEWAEDCGVTYLGRGAFSFSANSDAARAAKLTEFVVPASVTSFNYGMFAWSLSLQRVKIYAPITCIWDETFMRCDSLVEIWIPSTLTEIKGAAFGGWSGSPTDGAGSTGSFTVNFAGTEDQWNAVTIGSNNGVITDNKNELPTTFNYNAEY